MSVRHVFEPWTVDTANGEPLGRSWCGRAFGPFDFRLLDAEHAADCIQQQTLVQPCKRCVAAIKKAGAWPAASPADPAVPPPTR